MIRKTLAHSETVLDVDTVEDIGRALMPILVLLSTYIHVAIIVLLYIYTCSHAYRAISAR